MTRPACLLDRQFPEKLIFRQTRIYMKYFKHNFFLFLFFFGGGGGGMGRNFMIAVLDRHI